MKKRFSIVLVWGLIALLIPSAYAQTPEIAAVFAAPDQFGDIPDAFTQTDEQEQAGSESRGEQLSGIWFFYDDGSFQQYARVENQGFVLYSTGDYTISGGFGDADAGLTIHRTQTYADGIGLTADDSTQDYAIGDPGWIHVYPPAEEAVPAPAPVPSAVSAMPADDGEDAYIDEGADTGIEISAYAEYSGSPAFCFLSAGDKIAVISPSALPSREQTEATVEGLRSWGYEPVEGKHVCPELRTLEECIEDMKWALESPEIKAIFCVRGGYGATEVMDALPEDLIAAAGKPIIGYSDVTAFHAAWTCAGLPSIYACMSAVFGDYPEECAAAEQRMMRGELPTYRCEANALCREGTAEGILIGGNLSTFVASLDTAYDSTKLDQPYLLFFEEVGENMQHIHRYLTVLKHRGVLDKAAGIIFGEWAELPADGKGNYGETRGGLFDSVADMISRQFLDDLDVPVAFGFPTGHGEFNYPLLFGAAARLEVNADSYTLSWPAAAGT